MRIYTAVNVLGGGDVHHLAPPFYAARLLRSPTHAAPPFRAERLLRHFTFSVRNFVHEYV